MPYLDPFAVPKIDEEQIPALLCGLEEGPQVHTEVPHEWTREVIPAAVLPAYDSGLGSYKVRSLFTEYPL